MNFHRKMALSAYKGSKGNKGSKIKEVKGSDYFVISKNRNRKIMKKKEPAVGVVKATNFSEKKTTKVKKAPRLFWQAEIECYFEFCKNKFGEAPSFDGSSPRDFGMIVDAIEKKAVDKGVLWAEDVAVRSLNIFFEYCFKDPWLQNNFLLFNMNRQKDKIFFKIKSDIDGKSNSTQTGGKQFGSAKTAGQDLFAERIRRGLEKLR